MIPGPASTEARARQADSRADLRRTMCARRAALDAHQLACAAAALADRLTDTLRDARAIAGYLAIRGEIPLGPTLDRCLARDVSTAVPRVHGESLVFHAWHAHVPMRAGAFGIAEPDPDTATVDPWRCDVVLVPLVAFDASGNRLGMGGGFYDRTFASLATRRANGLPTPRLVGVAHDFQRVDTLPAEPWDVPLDRVVTDLAVHDVDIGADANTDIDQDRKSR